MNIEQITTTDADYTPAEDANTFSRQYEENKQTASEIEPKTITNYELIDNGKNINADNCKEVSQIENLKEGNSNDKTLDAKIKEEDCASDIEDEDDQPIIDHLDPAPLYRDPIFAEICSFFNIFTHLLGLKPMPILNLEKIFSTLVDGDVGHDLIDLHVTLMRKIYLKSARVDKWEGALQKFCSIAPGLETELRQLQRHHYVDVPLATKLTILKALCDSQFDCNLKFKENISNTFRHNELRFHSIGCDKTGQLYYFQSDSDLQFRLYTEEPEDMAGSSWTLKASNDAELIELIQTLRNPEFGKTRDEEEEGDTEIDEEQLLDQPKDKKKKSSMDSRPQSSASLKSKQMNDLQINLTEEDRAQIQMENKIFTLWDQYKKQDILNKRKMEHAKNKSERINRTSNDTIDATTSKTIISNDTVVIEKQQNYNNRIQHNTEQHEMNNEFQLKSPTGMEINSKTEKITLIEKKNEDVTKNDGHTSEFDEALLAKFEEEDRRRILPKRNARNSAIINLKVFNNLPRKNKDISVEPTMNSRTATKLSFMETAGSCSDDESDDEELDEDDDDTNEHTSDGEFYLDDEDRPKVRKFGRPPTKRTKVKSKKNGKRPVKGRSNKKMQRKNGRLSINPSNLIKSSITRKHQNQSVTYEEETTDDENTMDSAEREEKKRKKITEQSFCNRCNRSEHPDLLLLCDCCDAAWHTYCLRPQLWFVPDADWFCPICEHNSLIKRLIFALITIQQDRKTREQEQKRKAATSDRLKREMDYIGISLNNIIPLALNKKEISQIEARSSSSEEDVDDVQQRKSKKRAMKIVMSRTREQKKMEKWYPPVMTVTEGRSKRALNKVDYNFKSYDEQLQEAVEMIDPDAKFSEDESSSENHRHGKDMQNIIEAEQKKQKQRINEENGNTTEMNKNARLSSMSGRITKKAGRKSKRLTDLEIDNAMESDSDEWKASTADEMDEDPEPSEDEYLPSERRSNRRGVWARHKSDDDFIDDDDSDPDYFEGPKKKNAGKQTYAKRKRAKGRRRNNSSSSSVEEENRAEYQSDSQESGPSNKRKRKVPSNHIQSNKWPPKESTSDENSSKESDEEKSGEELTETGRPLRRAAAKVQKKIMEQVDDDEDDEIDEEEEDVPESDEDSQNKNNELEEGKEAANNSRDSGRERLADRAVSPMAFSKQRTTKMKGTNDEDFQPSEDEEAELDEEDEDELVDDEEEEQETSSNSSRTTDNDEKFEENKTEIKQTHLQHEKHQKNAESDKQWTNKQKHATVKSSKRKRQNQQSEYSDDEIENDDFEKDDIEVKQPISSSKETKSQKMTNTQHKTIDEKELRKTESASPGLQQTSKQQEKQKTMEKSNIENESHKVDLLAINQNEEKQTKNAIPEIEQSNSQKKLAEKGPINLQNTTNTKTTNQQQNATKPSQQPNSPALLPNKQYDHPASNIAPMTDSTTILQGKIETILKNATQASPIDNVSSKIAGCSTSSSTTTSPTVKKAPTIVQTVHPHQLSKYFLRPSTNTPPPPSPVQPQQQPINAQLFNMNQIPANNLPSVAQDHFALQPTPTTNFASYPMTGSRRGTMNVPPPMTITTAGLIHQQHLASGPISQFPPHTQPTAYYVQQPVGLHGAPPQVIYQTLQPYQAMLHPASTNAQQIQMQSGIIDPESLSHALAGAMNPEDL